MNEKKIKRGSWERTLRLIQGKIPNDISSVSLKLSEEKKIFIWIFDLRNDG